MKKLILSLVAAVFALSAYSHDSAKLKKTPEEMAGLRADKLKTELNLSDDQRSKVYTALLEKINKTRAVKEKYKDSSGRRKGMGGEIKAINQAFDNQMNSILNADQRTKYEAKKKERSEAKDRHRKENKDKKQSPKSMKGKKGKSE